MAPVEARCGQTTEGLLRLTTLTCVLPPGHVSAHRGEDGVEWMPADEPVFFLIMSTGSVSPDPIPHGWTELQPGVLWRRARRTEATY